MIGGSILSLQEEELQSNLVFFFFKGIVCLFVFLSLPLSICMCICVLSDLRLNIPYVCIAPLGMAESVHH